jgi:hypothetical protein
LLEPVVSSEELAWAAAEVCFQQFAPALAGEAKVDGDLGEWRGSPWLALGDPLQARSVYEPADHRASRAEADPQWSVKVGRRGLYLALRGSGQLTGDSFTVFLDPREPMLIGTPGRYYWVSGTFAADGKVELTPGDTSPSSLRGLEGTWRAGAGGLTAEVFLPYQAMARDSWPLTGDDIGFNVWWRHHGPGGVTDLMWAQYPYPWSPRGFGILRQAAGAADEMPWLVRLN